jgi:photosystem II stability/assembly factor-like uncharacterized protein
MCSIGDTVVAVGEGGIIQRSGYLEDWVPCAVAANRQHINEIVCNGNKIVAIGEKGSVLVSDSGVEWQCRNMAAEDAILSDIIWTGNEFVAVSLTGEIFVSNDANAWQRRHCEGMLYSVSKSPSVILAAGREILLVSTDGYTWTNTIIPADGITFFDICWADTCFFAVADSGNVFLLDEDGNILYRNKCETGNLYAAAWTGKEYIAAGESGVTVTSRDGVLWAMQSVPDERDIYAIFATSQNVIAAGAHGNMAIRSNTDGVWVNIPAPDMRINGITVCNERIVAAGDNGAVFTIPCRQTPGGIIGTIRGDSRRLPAQTVFAPGYSRPALYTLAGRRIGSAYLLPGRRRYSRISAGMSSQIFIAAPAKEDPVVKSRLE